jgi:hypothetical protein
MTAVSPTSTYRSTRHVARLHTTCAAGRCRSDISVSQPAGPSARQLPRGLGVAQEIVVRFASTVTSPGGMLIGRPALSFVLPRERARARRVTIMITAHWTRRGVTLLEPPVVADRAPTSVDPGKCALDRPRYPVTPPAVQDDEGDLYRAVRQPAGPNQFRGRRHRVHAALPRPRIQHLTTETTGPSLESPARSRPARRHCWVNTASAQKARRSLLVGGNGRT